MAQNIYDNPDFFEGYSQLSRSIDGLAGAPEWPALRALLPDLQGHDVLDLGCGYGWFCRWASEQDAADVLGLDVSEKMLERAKETTSAANIRYERADLEHQRKICCTGPRAVSTTTGRQSQLGRYAAQSLGQVQEVSACCAACA